MSAGGSIFLARNLLARLLHPRISAAPPADRRRSVSGEATSTALFFPSPYILSPAGVKVVDPHVLSPLPHCLVPLRKGERVRVCVRANPWVRKWVWGSRSEVVRVSKQRSEYIILGWECGRWVWGWLCCSKCMNEGEAVRGKALEYGCMRIWKWRVGVRETSEQLGLRQRVTGKSMRE